MFTISTTPSLISVTSASQINFAPSSTASSNTIERFTRHEEGDNGVIITNQRLVKEYREIIVAIDAIETI